MSDDEKKAYLEQIRAKRGYVLDFHRVMVAEDLPFMRALTALQEAAFPPRHLDRKTKELAFVAALVGAGAAKEHVKRHMEWAKDAGATKAEMLEMLEMLVPPLGIPRFMFSTEIWADVFDADRVA